MKILSLAILIVIIIYFAVSPYLAAIISSPLGTFLGLYTSKLDRGR